MPKLHAIFVLFCLFPTFMMGQYVMPEAEMPAKRHSLGINISTLVIYAFNAVPRSNELSLAYRYQLNPNRSLRVMADYEWWGEKASNQPNIDGELLAFDATSLLFQTRGTQNFQSGVRVGLEWFQPDHKIQMVYGLNAGVGLKREKENYYYTLYSWDEICSECGPRISDVGASSAEINSLALGIDLNIGPRFNINERFNILLQFSPLIEYTIPLSESYSDETVRKESVPSALYIHPLKIETYFQILF